MVSFRYHNVSFRQILTNSRLFLISGITTVVCAAICVFVLPDYPSTTRWLTPEEKAFAQWRLRKDASEDDDIGSTSLWHGMKLAFQDYRIWLFMLLQHLSTLAMTFQYFFPSIVATLGFGQTQSLLLTVS